MTTKTAELVFVPTPGMGHLLSTIQLAKRLLSTHPSISISIHIINPDGFGRSQIHHYVDSQSRHNPYPTRFTLVPLPPLSDLPDPSSPNFVSTVIDLHKPIVKQTIEDRIRSGFPKPTGFVLDMFCLTMVDVANHLNIPSYSFCTSGAGSLSFMFHAQSMVDHHGIDVPTVFSQPGFSTTAIGFKNPVPSSVIPAVLQDKNGGANMFFNIARKFRETKGILINTFEELESYCVHALLDDKTIPPVYPVGPIVELDQKSRGGSGSVDGGNHSVMSWLDGHPNSSVVFLCFGSMGCFDEGQVKNIANGLEKSGYRFLWALRKPPQEGTPTDNETFEEALPEGFLERTAGRGKVIGWAPQVEILGHPSVGGFVTHCGWNSALESLWYGVPMATIPLYAEQQLNAFSLVKELGVAVEIRMDYKKDWREKKANMVVTAEEIEGGIKKLMDMEEGTRGRVKEMSKISRKALEEGGSSSRWIRRFTEHVFTNHV